MRKFLDIIDLTLIVVVGISVLGHLYFRWYTDAAYAFVILILMVYIYAQNKAMIQLETELKEKRKALQDALKTTRPTGVRAQYRKYLIKGGCITD